MVELAQAFLVVLLLINSRVGLFHFLNTLPFETRMRRIAARLFCSGLIITTFFGCIMVSALLHEPLPRSHDEFSYFLMADTFAHGRLANHSPFLPEFFETFHVVMHPLYVSKYFPAEGLFLLIGQKMNGRPAVGVWLSSSLACVAAYWMLLAWSGSNGAMIGALLWMFQYGIFSYWSQSYWGGMVAAIGGTLVLGAVRRLSSEISWRTSACLSLGLVVLAGSRPVEGLIAITPSILFVLYNWLCDQTWREAK